MSNKAVAILQMVAIFLIILCVIASMVSVVFSNDIEFSNIQRGVQYVAFGLCFIYGGIYSLRILRDKDRMQSPLSIIILRAVFQVFFSVFIIYKMFTGDPISFYLFSLCNCWSIIFIFELYHFIRNKYEQK